MSLEYAFLKLHSLVQCQLFEQAEEFSQKLLCEVGDNSGAWRGFVEEFQKVCIVERQRTGYVSDGELADEYQVIELLIKNELRDLADSLGKDLLLRLQQGTEKHALSQQIVFELEEHGIVLEADNPPETKPVNTQLGDLTGDRAAGVTIVTACMNRNSNLIKSLRTWLVHDEIKEIIVVDWSSSRSVYADIQKAGLLDPRVRVADVPQQQCWVLTRAFNIGFRLASFDKILKVDADVVLSPDFFKLNKLEKNQFVTGDWRIAEKNQQHINGFFYIHRVDLAKSNGFNEFIDTYGWDDDELYGRLEYLGVERKRVTPESLFHLHHKDADRGISARNDCRDALDELEKDTFYKIRQNKFIANAMPVWGRRSGHLDLSIRSISKQYRLLQQNRPSFHQVPDHIRQDARYYAAVEITSWTVSRRVYDLDKDIFWRFLETKRFAQMHRLDMTILANGNTMPDYEMPFWVLDWYEDAFDEVSSNESFLSILQSWAAKKKINLVLRVGDGFCGELIQKAKQCENVFVIPASEAHGNYELVQLKDIERVVVNADSGYFSSDINRCNLTDLMALVQTNFELSLSHFQVPSEKIFVDVQHGLGNRLRALASAVVMGEKSGREVVLIWQPDVHCEARVSDLIHYQGAVVEESFYDELPDSTDLYNYMEVEENSEKDALVQLKSGKDVYVRTSCVINSPLSNWGRENRVLKQLRPVEYIMSLVEPFSLASSLAVHVRMEGAEGLDHHKYERPENWSREGLDSLQYWRGKSHYSNFIQHLDRLLEDNPSLHFFLATDRASTYQIFGDLYKDRMSYLKRTQFDRSREQIQFALADAILLSKCKRLMGSTWSSFTELATRLSDGFETVEMSGVDF